MKWKRRRRETSYGKQRRDEMVDLGESHAAGRDQRDRKGESLNGVQKLKLAEQAKRRTRQTAAYQIYFHYLRLRLVTVCQCVPS